MGEVSRCLFRAKIAGDVTANVEKRDGVARGSSLGHLWLTSVIPPAGILAGKRGDGEGEGDKQN